MWIEDLVLQSPYTFIVLAILLLLLGLATIARTAAAISRTSTSSDRTGESRTSPEPRVHLNRSLTWRYQPVHPVPRRSFQNRRPSSAQDTEPLNADLPLCRAEEPSTSYR